MSDENLVQAIVQELRALEAEGDIVICTANPVKTARHIAEAVLRVVPQTDLTTAELSSVRKLIEKVVADAPAFFDDSDVMDEVGLDAASAHHIASKMPNGV